MTRRKKIIIAIFLALLAGAGAYYFFVLRKAPPIGVLSPAPRFGFLPEPLARFLGARRTGPTGPVSPTPISPAERKQQRLYRVSNGPALAPAIAPSQNTVLYFLRAGGTLWQADFEGLSPQRVVETPLQGLVGATWAKDGARAVVTLIDPTDTPRKYAFDFSTKKFTELNRFIRSVAFSPKGDKIVYQYLNTTNGDDRIATANPDGSGFKNIFQPLFDDFSLAWPREETAVLQTNPSYASLTRLYSIDARVGTLTKVLPEDRYGAASVWSGDGSRALVSQTSADGELLHLLATTLRQSQPRELFGVVTFAEKCVWKKDGVSVVCGVPTTAQEPGQKLPDDYYNGLFVSTDGVVEINVETLKTRTIARAEELFPNLDIESPILSPDESRMFFVNRHDGYIYALRLQP